jgi:hypothetical protein
MSVKRASNVLAGLLSASALVVGLSTASPAATHAAPVAAPLDVILRAEPPSKQCESLLPQTQPRYWGTAATQKPVLWLISVNFQQQFVNENGPGVTGCMTIIGRDPANINASYRVLHEQYFLCYFSTKNIAGSFWTTEDFGGQGLVTFGPPTLDAAAYSGTGSGLWQPVRFERGAYLRCPGVNLKGYFDYEQRTLPNSAVTAQVDLDSVQDHFTMAAFGYSAWPVANPASRNPLVSYVPDAAACGNRKSCGTSALSAPFFGGKPGWTLTSRLNGVEAASSIVAQADTLQYLHSEFASGTPRGTVYHRRYDSADPRLPRTYQDTLSVRLNPNPGKLRFWAGSSTLYVGFNPASPTDTFEGTLYEVLIDPSGDNKPGQ